MTYEIRAICVGSVNNVTLGDGSQKKTAVNKFPITSNTFLSRLGLTGDEHEYHGHGGVNKAICLYDYNDYALWTDYIPNMPDFAMFGENITTVGLTKDVLSIGDIFSFGDAIIQVTEGRGPCSTIAKKYNVSKLVKMMSARHATGCYFRVLQEGMVTPKSALALLEKHPLNFTIDNYNALMYTDQKNIDLLHKAVAVDALPEEHKALFNKRLQKLI